MCSPELSGIYIDTHHPTNQGDSFADGSPEVNDKVSSGSSSGIGSNSSSIVSNNNLSNLARKRNNNFSPESGEMPCESTHGTLDDFEMEKFRRLMAQVDGDRRSSGGSIVSSHRGSIEPSLMSTVFAVVLVIIISISVYAFASLYRAVVKRMSG